MRILTLVLSLISLAGCGWQLRGVTPLPSEYRVLHIQSQAAHSFNQQLTLQLEFNNVVLVSNAGDAQAVLRLQPVNIERRTLALTSSGQIAEYELLGKLIATLKRHDRNSEVLIEVTARRYMANDINNVTGTQNTERQQRADLEKDLVNKLLRRLQRVDYDNEAIELPEPAAATDNHTAIEAVP